MCLEAIVHVLWLVTIVHQRPDEIAGRRWLTRCDNQSWQKVAHKGDFTRNPVCAALLAYVHSLQCKFHFALDVEYIDTNANLVSDLLSRGEIEKFKDAVKLTGYSSPVRVQMPLRTSMCSYLMSIKRLYRPLLPEHVKLSLWE